MFSAGPVCSSFSTEAYSASSLLVLAAPMSMPLLFSYLILGLSLPLCPLLHLSFYLNLWQELSSLSFTIRLQWVPGHSFLLGTTWLMSWLDRERYLFPQQSLVVSLLLSLISTLFLDWRHTVSSKFFDLQVPSISTEELVLLPDACCVLSHLCCNRHNLLLSSYL